MDRVHFLFRKGKGFIVFLAFFSSFAFAGVGGYVLDDHDQLFPASIPFINELSSNFFEKTGVSIYVIASDSLRGHTLEEYKSAIAMRMRQPYLYILFVKQEKKIDINGDQELLSKIDSKGIYWDYIVPLIPNKDSELTSSNISAFLVNGYLALIEELSLALNVKLENEYVPQNKAVQSTTKIVLYAMTLSLLLIFLFFSLRKKSARSKI